MSEEGYGNLVYEEKLEDPHVKSYFKVFEKGILYVQKGRLYSWMELDEIRIIHTPYTSDENWLGIRDKYDFRAVELRLLKNGKTLTSIPTHLLKTSIPELKQAIEHASVIHRINVVVRKNNNFLKMVCGYLGILLVGLYMHMLHSGFTDGRIMVFMIFLGITGFFMLMIVFS
ncbi:MAG: hypothetical protein ABIH11_05275 [Candidatus Altiarchaeota archaeon]